MASPATNDTTWTTLLATNMASPARDDATSATLLATTSTTLLATTSTTLLATNPAIQNPDIEALQESITAFYLIIMGALIWAMQPGFTFLEAGTIRQKNTTNSLTRMFMNGWIAAVMWWLVGYAFAFGTGNGFIGFNSGFDTSTVSSSAKWALGSDPADNLALWFFEYAFCAASAAIISNGVAEHVTHHGFVLYCVFFTGWIYPIAAHWEWGADGWLLAGKQYPTTANNSRATAVVEGNVTNYYYTANYQDFAGSGVVHITGAFAGLAALLIVRPRTGMDRSFREPPAEKPTPHSLPLTTLGCMLLTFGFFAFNGGSQLTLHKLGDAGAMSTAVCNTTISGAGGALSAIFWRKYFGYFRVCNRDGDGKGKWSLGIAINGSLAGMVAVCAGCNAYYPWGAFVVGVIAGLQLILWIQIITKLRIDDPADSFAVHGGSGIWGALAVALLKQNGGIVVVITDAYGTHGNCTAEGWTYFAWQMLGVVTIAGWAFANMAVFMLLLRLIDIMCDRRNVNFRLLRPRAKDQLTGMDEVENGETAYFDGDLVATAGQNGSAVSINNLGYRIKGSDPSIDTNL